jgi:hypothetical protein
VTQFALATLKSADDLTQRLCLSQLAKQHRHQLLPAGKPLGGLLRFHLTHQTLKNLSVNRAKKLAKEAAMA